MENLAIIQARTGATRLPNKVLMELQGKTVLEHVINRVKRSKFVDEVVVATTISKNDLQIVKLCAELDVRVFVGSEDDVLDRYYQLAKLLHPKNVIRITADCPMIDADIIDKVIKEHIQGGYDYTSNTLSETYPDGEDIEAMRFSVLEEAWVNANMASQREHVTQYIIGNDKYEKYSVENNINLGDKRWTLDTEDDYKFINEIFSLLYFKNENFGMNEVLEIIEAYPIIEKINSYIMRNEGLKKSLTYDHKIKKK